MAMPPILQRIENLRKSLFGTGTKLLGTIMPYGNTANTVCEGDDSRLSDARTPKAHNHSPNDLTSAVPVNKGGTGAATAEAARENLEITPENIGALAEGGKAVSATKADSAAKLTTARTISITGDVTGSTSFDGSANESIAATLAASGVTAGSYGPSANATPAAGATFNVPQVTVDAKGRVTAAVNRTVKIPAAPTSVSGNAGTATKLATARTIDGVDFNGSAAITHYGSCSTAAATAAKTVAITRFKLVTGAVAFVRFTVTNTAANPTLNINGTGAKAIQYRNAAISAGYLAANRTYAFVYDGSSYELVGDVDTNTTYKTATASVSGLNKLSDATNSTLDATGGTAATPKAVKMAYDKANSAASAASTAQTTANEAKTAAQNAASAASTAQSTASAAQNTANAANTAATNAQNTANTASKTAEGVYLTTRTTLPNYGTWLCGVKIRETVSFRKLSGGSYPINNSGDECMAVRIS